MDVQVVGKTFLANNFPGKIQCINDMGEISKGTFNTTNFDGDAEFGGLNMSNGSPPQNDDKYAVTIKWDERQETVELKQQKQ